MRIIFSSLLLMTVNLAFAGTVETLKLKTPRGVEIDAVIHYPDATATATAPAPVPAVIIGSGQGYHMGLPLTEGLAKKIAEKGYVAIRFNWNYFSHGGQPSEDLSNEVEDFATAVAFAKTNPKIDKDKIIVAGKSLGTIVSYKYFTSDTQVKALVLMTPVCTWRWDDKGDPLPTPIGIGAETYPELLNSKRPIVVALGNSDPMCSIPMLYDFLKDSTGNIATIVVEGDHSLNVGAGNDPAFEKRNAENIGAATEMIAHWVSLIVNRL